MKETPQFNENTIYCTAWSTGNAVTTDEATNTDKKLSIVFRRTGPPCTFVRIRTTRKTAGENLPLRTRISKHARRFEFSAVRPKRAPRHNLSQLRLRLLASERKNLRTMPLEPKQDRMNRY